MGSKPEFTLTASAGNRVQSAPDRRRKGIDFVIPARAGCLLARQSRRHLRQTDQEPFYDIPELNVEHRNDSGIYAGQSWGAVDTVSKHGLAKGKGLLNDPIRGGSLRQYPGVAARRGVGDHRR